MTAVSGVIDSHAHIDFPHYTDDRDDMLARMRDAGAVSYTHLTLPTIVSV